MVETEMIEYRLNGPASQERISIRLMAALREHRFPQSILIDGPVGIGKKALAMEIAQALQCTNPSVRPCGNCFGCKMATDTGVTDNWVVPMEAKEASARNAADVSAGSSAKTIQDFKQAYIEEIAKNPYRVDIFSAGAVISVELIRTMTASFAMKGDRVRVVIIAEADRMNDSAANAFLKTLEEVPPNTYFILTTSSREKLLQTIRSRCLALHLPPLTDDEVRKEAIRVGGEDFNESALTDDVIGLAVGSPVFFKLEDSGLEDPAIVNRFLEVLSFLITDLLRRESGAPLRIPEATGSVNLERYPQVGASALETALVCVQETMSRIASRRMAAVTCLQNLSLKLFEGYK